MALEIIKDEFVLETLLDTTLEIVELIIEELADETTDETALEFAELTAELWGFGFAPIVILIVLPSVLPTKSLMVYGNRDSPLKPVFGTKVSTFPTIWTTPFGTVIV